MGNICTSPKNNLSQEDRPIRNTERSNLLTPTKPIDKWNVDDVFEWLSRIDDGALYELAIKFKKNKIRGCILDNVKEVQLIEMDVAMGDRMLFNKKRIQLFHKYNYMPNNIILTDQNSNPISHHSNHAQINQSQNSNPNPSHHSHSNEGNIIEGNHPQKQPHPQIQPPIMPYPMRYQSAPMYYPGHQPPHPLQPHPPHGLNYNRTVPQYIPANMPQTQLLQSSSSSHNNATAGQNGCPGVDTIEENIYADIDFRDLQEGNDHLVNTDIVNAPRMKPPLNRSASADEYKKNKNVQIKSHSFKSASNPIHGSNNINMNLMQQKMEVILKIAKILKDIMGNDIKNGKEIIEILSKKDTINDFKYEQICQLLLAQKFLVCSNASVPLDDTKLVKFSLLKTYEFNHQMYDSFVSKSVTISAVNKPNLQSKSLSNITRRSNKTPVASIHINNEYKYCGGTQVKVFSPKSNKIRPGLILSYDENTKKARICCYDSMGKQSMKTLPLPHPCVKPQYPTQSPNTNTTTQPSLSSISPTHYPSQSPTQPQPQPQPQLPYPMTAASWNYNYRDNNRN